MTLGTIAAILVLALLGWAAPVAMMRWLPDSLRGLCIAVALSVPALTLAGAGLFALSYAHRLGAADLGALAERDAVLHFSGLGLRAALIWAPVLALTALGLAQGIERRRGERMAARDGD